MDIPIITPHSNFAVPIFGAQLPMQDFLSLQTERLNDIGAFSEKLTLFQKDEAGSTESDVLSDVANGTLSEETFSLPTTDSLSFSDTLHMHEIAESYNDSESVRDLGIATYVMTQKFFNSESTSENSLRIGG